MASATVLLILSFGSIATIRTPSNSIPRLRPDTAEVDAFHAAALKAGGTENGAPGLRRPNYYAGFVLDPDGNNIEAVFRGD